MNAVETRNVFVIADSHDVAMKVGKMIADGHIPETHFTLLNAQGVACNQPLPMRGRYLAWSVILTREEEETEWTAQSAMLG